MHMFPGPQANIYSLLWLLDWLDGLRRWIELLSSPLVNSSRGLIFSPRLYSSSTFLRMINRNLKLVHGEMIHCHCQCFFFIKNNTVVKSFQTFAYPLNIRLSSFWPLLLRFWKTFRKTFMREPLSSTSRIWAELAYLNCSYSKNGSSMDFETGKAAPVRAEFALCLLYPGLITRITLLSAMSSMDILEAYSWALQRSILWTLAWLWIVSGSTKLNTYCIYGVFNLKKLNKYILFCLSYKLNYCFLFYVPHKILNN